MDLWENLILSFCLGNTQYEDPKSISLTAFEVQCLGQSLSTKLCLAIDKNYHRDTEVNNVAESQRLAQSVLKGTVIYEDEEQKHFKIQR